MGLCFNPLQKNSLGQRLWWIALAVLLALTGVPTRTLAQEDAVPPGEEAAKSDIQEFLEAGGTVGYLIIGLSIISLTMVFLLLLTIRRGRLMPSDVAEDLEIKIKSRQINEAVKICQDPANRSLLTNVVMAGLQRYKASEFGFAEYRSAVEEAGEEQTARLYRQTEILAVIGAIAPMLGLLGTVQGMIEAFDTIAATGGTATPADLADSISKALVTTLEGLIVAIPTLMALSFFRTRIDSLVAEAGSRIEQIMLPLSRQK